MELITIAKIALGDATYESCLQEVKLRPYIPSVNYRSVVDKVVAKVKPVDVEIRAV